MADPSQEGLVPQAQLQGENQAEGEGPAEYLPFQQSTTPEDGANSAPAVDVATTFAVKTHGLPYEATKNEIVQFLSNCNILNGKDGVHILQGPDGRPSGDAIVELERAEDVELALKHDGENMGRRYVEVSQMTAEQVDWELGRQPGAQFSSENGGKFVVRLRGLPWAATAQDVLWLLKDCQLVSGEKGVHFTFAPDGRPSGEAFVELCTEEDVSKALSHDNEHMGKRYVEIFRASRGQMEWEVRMEEKVGGGLGSGGVVRLRGLPFKCSEEEVRKFFSGLAVVPGGIIFQNDGDTGRETGEGYVEFTTKEDAEKALERDRKLIGRRYIEVFRSTHAEIKPVTFRGGMGGSRPTPYDRPGGRGGYGGYGGRGFGAKYGSGFERGHRGGRGRGGGPVGPAAPPGGGPGFMPFDPYGGGGFFEDQEFYPPPGSFEEGGFPPPAAAAAAAGSSGGQNLVAYPPIRPSQPGPGQGGLGQPKTKQHAIRMRGLPFSAKEKDITDFFAPLVPTRVNIDFDHYGRRSGEAEVQFNSHEDAAAAMQKNNAHMGHRYIELFLKDDIPGAAPMMHPRGGGQMGGASRGGAMGQRYPPPQQQSQQSQPTTWNDPRTQGRALGEMGQQQQVASAGQPAIYDSSGSGGYGQSAGGGQQYAAAGQQYGTAGQQYGGYQQQQQQPQASQQHQQQQWSGGYGTATGYSTDTSQQGYQQPGYASQAQGHDSYGQQQQQPQQPQQWGYQ